MTREGVFVLNRTEFGKLRLSGPEALWFLDQLLTNRIEDLVSGRGCETLLLSHNGKIQAAGQVLNLEGVIYFSYEPRSANLYDFLSSRIFATKVEIEDVSELLSVFDLYGNSADEILLAAHADAEIPGSKEYDVAPVNGAPIVRLRRPALGLSLWSMKRASEEVQVLIGDDSVAASMDDIETIRVLDGYQRFGQDYDSTFLPQEAALERAVHFDKGCYLGQEAVAMVQRGRAKRRLRRIAFEGRALRGDLFSDGDLVGKVTSIGSLEDRGLGIGVVSTSVKLGSTVEVRSDRNSAVATVEELPGAPTGPSVPTARELREHLRGGPET